MNDHRFNHRHTLGSLFSVNVKKGHFTHIILDEAAQMMEVLLPPKASSLHYLPMCALQAEALIPLTLADEQSVLVMAGDYQQLGLHLVSPSSKLHRLDKSIMVRLQHCVQLLVYMSSVSQRAVCYTLPLFRKGWCTCQSTCWAQCQACLSWSRTTNHTHPSWPSPPSTSTKASSLHMLRPRRSTSCVGGQCCPIPTSPCSFTVHTHTHTRTHSVPTCACDIAAAG
jgi:hypothetical protein